MNKLLFLITTFSFTVSTHAQEWQEEPTTETTQVQLIAKANTANFFRTNFENYTQSVYGKSTYKMDQGLETEPFAVDGGYVKFQLLEIDKEYILSGSYMDLQGAWHRIEYNSAYWAYLMQFAGYLEYDSVLYR